MNPSSFAIVSPGLLAAGLVAMWLGFTQMRRSQVVERRIEHYVDPEQAVREQPAKKGRQWHLETAFTPALNRLLSRSSFGLRLRDRLARAGLSLQPSEFILVQAGGAALAFVAGRLMSAQFELLGDVADIAIPLASAALGLLVPLVALLVLERRRVAAFERQLPGAIDAMAGTLQAGSTLSQAMDSIAREMEDPLASELRKVVRDVEVGLSLPEAMVRLVQRMPSADLVLLSSAIRVQNRVGGDLAPLLQGISSTIRERLRVRADIKVLTSQARYSAYLLAFLPVGLFCYLYATSYDYVSQLFLPGLTRLLFAGGCAGIVIGLWSMRKIATVEV